MKNNYTYPVVLDYSEKNFINIVFPTFNNAVTCAEVGENYIKEAQDFLALTILDYEESKKELPEETMPLDIMLSGDKKIIYINVWMPYHRSSVKETYVKKTLTIPTWIDELAKKENINFSATLVNALKEKLKIE